MSWTTKSKNEKLRKALTDAASKCLVFCACDDKGVREETMNKVLKNKLIRVGAADSVHRARLVSDESVDFMVDGEEILVDGPMYMNTQSKRNITGSSVATALAAGIGSLALTLLKIRNHSFLARNLEYKKELKKKEFCLRVFQKMIHDGDKDRVLDPTLLFPMDRLEVGANMESVPKALDKFDMTCLIPELQGQASYNDHELRLDEIDDNDSDNGTQNFYLAPDGTSSGEGLH
jgi:hypothetical protein